MGPTALRPLPRGVVLQIFIALKIHFPWPGLTQQQAQQPLDH
jgi:hypothetical protein